MIQEFSFDVFAKAIFSTLCNFWQAFESKQGADSIERSYELFNFAIIVAMDCNASLGPRKLRAKMREQNCTASGSFYHEQADQVIALEAKMNSTHGTLIIEAPASCSNTTIESISIYGALFAPNEMEIDTIIDVDLATFDKENQRLDIVTLSWNICNDLASKTSAFSWRI